jgi:hypothetical protein
VLTGSERRRPRFWWIEASAVGVVVVVGLVLRFWTSSHLWLDEALSVDIARLPAGQITEALRHDGHPPLYYFLLHGWMDVFGQGDVAVRALSGVLSVAALPLAWLAGRRVAGRPGAWAALVLLALSPFAIRYGTETRMYSLVMLLVLAGYLLVAQALDAPKAWTLVSISVLTGLLLLSHYWGLWFVTAVIAVLAFVAWRTTGDVRGRVVKVAVAIAGGGLLLVPWLPVMLDQAAHTGTPWAAPVRPTTIVTQTLQDVGGGDYAEAILLGFALLALFGLGLFGRAIDARRIELDVRTVPQVRWESAMVGATIVLASAAGYATHTTFASRYASVFVPLFMIVVAVGLTRFDGRLARGLVASGVLALGLVGGVHNVITDRTQAGDITSAIRAGATPADLVVICPDQLGPSVHRLLPKDLDQVTYPLLAGPDLVDWRDYEERNAAADPRAAAEKVVERARAEHAANLWLVTSGSYKTFEGQCETLLAELSARLGNGEGLIAEDNGPFFEYASLFRFSVPPAPGP